MMLLQDEKLPYRFSHGLGIIKKTPYRFAAKLQGEANEMSEDGKMKPPGKRIAPYLHMCGILAPGP